MVYQKRWTDKGLISGKILVWDAMEDVKRCIWIIILWAIRNNCNKDSFDFMKTLNGRED